MTSNLLRRALVLAFLATGGAVGAPAQCLDWRSFPLVENEFGGPVYAACVHDDGGGSALFFLQADPFPTIRPMRWDGSARTEVGSGVSGGINDMLRFDDGSGPKLYIAGEFTIPGVVGTVRIARWDGASWQTFGGATPDRVVVDLEVHDDGSGPDLYAAGDFTQVGGVNAGGVARWDGSAWSVVGPVPGFAAGRHIVRLATHDDGTAPALIARTSNISTEPWWSSDGFAQWRNGAWSGITPGGGTAYDLQSWDDGTGPALYSVGNFDGVRRWNGTSWQSIATFGRCGTLDVVDAGNGPRLYAGNAIPAVGAHAWDGTSWTDLAPNASASCTYTWVNTFVAFDDGSGPALYAGAWPGSLGVLGAALTRWNGTAWEGIGSAHHGLDGTLRALHVFDSGAGPELIGAGLFCGADQAFASNVAGWDGEQWRALRTPGPSGIVAPGELHALATHDAGNGPRLYAMGLDALWDWDGTSWTAHDGGTPGFGQQFDALASFQGLLYVGGTFNGIHGWNSPNLARWSLATGFVGFGPGANGRVYALTTHDDGTGVALYAAGTFTLIGGTSANRIARTNGSVWNPLGAGVDGFIDALAVFDDGSGPALYAGGVFANAGGAPAVNVARWNGSSWSALGAGLPGQVLSLSVFDDGSGPALHAGGTFTSVGGQPASVARWNGATWTRLGASTDGPVWALRAHDDGTGIGPQLFAGGDFEHAGTNPSRSFAAWRGCGGEIARFCFGDGSVATCPCENFGTGFRGCDNSASTGGARLNATGSVTADTIQLYVAGELPNAATLVFQGDALLTAPVVFGDGLRCVGGNLVRLYTTNAVGGSLAVPATGQPSVSARSAAQGDPLAPGDVRGYQAWYRDANPGFCGPPTGNAWNLSNAVRIVW